MKWGPMEKIKENTSWQKHLHIRYMWKRLLLNGHPAHSVNSDNVLLLVEQAVELFCRAVDSQVWSQDKDLIVSVS